MPRTLNGVLGNMALSIKDLKETKRNNGLQRRNKVVDVYGYEFHRQGATNAPATVHVSVSQDLIYYERFEFKLIVTPFIVPISQGGTDPVTLDIVGQTADATVPPNTHAHGAGSLAVTPNTHSHTVTAGITTFQSSFSNFRVVIEGIDITAELRQQYGGEWITGEGVYPREDLANYDILKAVGYLTKAQRDIILAPGYKKIELMADGFFNVTLVNYLKYSHVNR